MAGDELDVALLSETEQLALQQFTSVTDQSLEDSVPLLRRSQWNVQIAIAKFFDGETADPVAEAQASIPPPRQSTQRETLLDGSASFANRQSPSNSSLEAAPRIVPQPESHTTQRPSSLLAILFAPFNIIYRLLSSSLGFLSYLFPFLPRLTTSISQTIRTRTQRGASISLNTIGRRPLNPRDTAARFLREFEEEYGSHTLPFFEDGYAQAHDLAKKDLKFLLVVLLSPEHDSTSTFVKDTLLAPEVVDFITNSENNIILWAGSVQGSEAYQVSTSLGCTKFPFTAVVAHAPRTSSNAMSTLARLRGPIGPSRFVAQIRETISQYSEELGQARATQASHQAERNLRTEQDSAYERSLAQDRERARQKREAEASKAKAEQEEKARQQAEAKRAQNLLRWKRWRIRSLSAEPTSPEDNKNASRLSIRLPSGERVIRKFAANVPMEELYAFVECYDVVHPSNGEAGPSTGKGKAVASDDDPSNLDDDGPPDDYEHRYGFNLVSPMPRIVYGLDEQGSVGERIGRSGNLIVEAIDEDDED